MAGERGAWLRRGGQDALSALMQEVERSNDLRALHGRKLDLSDDSPDWFLHKLLKEEGVAPPAIERGRDLDAACNAAVAIVERLHRRREWLIDPRAGCTSEAAAAFNRRRTLEMEGYRHALTVLNRAIRDYNLMAPLPLQRYGYRIEHEMERAADRVPPLDERLFPAPHGQRGRGRRWRPRWPWCHRPTTQESVTRES